MIYFLIIVAVWIVTYFWNKRYDDDPVKDFARLIVATFVTGGILFFWHWI